MKIKKEKLQEAWEYISEYKKWGITVLLAILIIWEIHTYRSLLQEQRELSKTIAKLKKRVSQQRGVITQLEQARAKLRAYTSRIKTFQSDALVFAQVKDRINRIAQEHSVDIRRANISRTRNVKNDIFETHIFFFFTGKTPDILPFLEAFEKYIQKNSYEIETFRFFIRPRIEKGQKVFYADVESTIKILWRKK